jgi:hypothetical protein
MTQHPQQPTPLLGHFDPGFLFLLAGLALLAAAVLIPAQQDLAQARWRRDAALAHEQTHRDRLDRYQQYLAALDRNDPAVLESLTLRQLNIYPDHAEPVGFALPPARQTASIFHQLEPPPTVVPEAAHRNSFLARLVTDRHARLWVIGFAALCILYSVLPRTTRPG